MIEFTNYLTVEEHDALYATAGWTATDFETTQNGLRGSDYIITARDNGRAIATARTLSDGGYFVFVVDVIVHTDYRGQGLGRAVLEKVLAHYSSKLHDGQKISVNLMAAKDKEGFYEKLGFFTHPTQTLGHGMTCYLYQKEK